MNISDVKTITEKLLKALTVDVGRVEVAAGDPHPLISVSTSDSGILIGPQGEHLRALNYIAKKIVEAHADRQTEEQPSFLIDINGYHRKHIAAVKQQARILSERARTFRSDVAMEPMNSYDRMIVHSVFVDDQEISTESAGVGKQRHIVFKYKKADEPVTSSDRELFAEEGATN